VAIIFINVPVVYMARYVMVLRRARSITRAIGNRDYFGPCPVLNYPSPHRPSMASWVSNLVYPYKMRINVNIIVRIFFLPARVRGPPSSAERTHNY
jgi:hypothetical protein